MEEREQHLSTGEGSNASPSPETPAPPHLAAGESGERCPACGVINAPGADICSRCGQRLLPLEKRTGTRESYAGLSAGEAPSPEPRPAVGGPGEAGAEAAESEGMELRYYFGPVRGGVTLRPAGLARRFLALCGDWILVNLVALLVAYVAGAGEQLAEFSRLVEQNGWHALAGSLSGSMEAFLTALGAVQFAVALGLYTIFTAYGGSTPGMLLLGIQVTRTDGSQVTFPLAVARSAVLWLLIFLTMGAYLLVAALYTFIDPRGRSLHDVLTGTNVYLRDS